MLHRFASDDNTIDIIIHHHLLLTSWCLCLHSLVDRRHYVFALSVMASVPSSVVSSSVCSMPNIFLSLHNYTEQSLIKFNRGNQCHKRIKWLSIEQNWNRNVGAGYDRKFAITSFGFSTMSNQCWCLASEFTNFTALMMADVIMDKFHVNLQNFTNFV